MSYCVGLTGTIASGKSTAAHYFATQGIQIISADKIAHQLVEKGQPALTDICNHFGQDILHPNGELNRQKLRAQIIANPSDKTWLEQYLHPKIRQIIEQQAQQSQSVYTIIEIPLLSTRDDYPYLNHILLIKTSIENQISRIIARDHCTPEHARALLQIQSPYITLHETIADDIVYNNLKLEEFNKKLEELHHLYLSAAKKASISCSVKEEK